MSFLRGCLALLLIILNFIIITVTVLPFAIIAHVLPKKAHRYVITLALKILVFWTIVNQWILKLNTQGKWDIQGKGVLNSKGWYIIISNHTSWIDIPVLGSIFNRKIPLIKFFMKKELLWQLPIAGINCYLLGYPILARHTRTAIRKNPALKRKDIEATKKACQKFKVFPTTFMNFVEGTRFTQEKHQRQQSPYQHLLKPKAAGTATVLTEMSDKLNGIINTTLYYEAKELNFWRFLCGKINKIHIRYEVIPITDSLIGNYYDDRQYRKHFQQWLNCIWQEKDTLIDALKNKQHEKSH